VNQEKICSVIVRPLSTEKTNAIGDKFNQYAVIIDRKATKLDVKRAAEALFKVKVKKVNILNYKPTAKFFGKYKGNVSGYKKAYVQLYPGHEIVFSEIG
jgi:large subunit ribosomal protein L23